MPKEHEMRTVLVVDDEPDMLSMLQLVIEKKCQCRVLTALSGTLALEIIEQEHPDVVVTDIKMPDLDGLQLLKEISKRDATTSTVIMTGFGTIDMAVQALKDGAYDFLQKPFEKDHIVRIINNCLERTALLRTNIKLRHQLDSMLEPHGFVGQSPPLKRIIELITRIADTDATVLIRGESGTGKEVAARALHQLSNRRKRQMIAVNCPALPENVLESELFGYTQGAFTGALKEKKGLFSEAHGSTIHLDEIADIPVSVQTKLLRVLQEKEIQPLGQNRTQKVDVRVVASTNQDLEAKIATGHFREDLYYRLNVVTINMPNLQELKEDIPLLLHHFLERYKKKYNRPQLELTMEVMQYLCSREWQGNIRELQNTTKRLVLLSQTGTITLSDLQDQQINTEHDALPHPVVPEDLLARDYNDAKAAVIEQFSRRYLENVLTRTGGNVTNAAALCGLERQALQRIMRRYTIRSSDFKE